ncbi:unnamed protein product [Paramecium pentaurelia]|uniref:Tetratricopeptide repeat protein n=1 Tax=Paramecium pentaurelia TaxID=43138 RepID=A0A8S1Y6P5_9CILI|nr:unnamed protein product [Paramecium pentaurelia]
MDSCQKVHHKINGIIGICLRCKDDYLSCKLCFAELHYQHNEDFLLIDNILLLLDQVIQKIDQAKEKLKLNNWQQFNTFIKSKYSQLQKIRSQFMNRQISINLLNVHKNNIEETTLNEILYQLSEQSQYINEQEIENIKQIFIHQFQKVQMDHLIIQMLDRCRLLCSIQRYKEAHQLSQTLLKLTNKKYFLQQSLQQLNQITMDIWSVECLLGRNLYLIKEYNKSIEFFEKLCQSNQNEQILSECYIYLSLNLILTKKYDEALNNLAIYHTLSTNNLFINFFEGFALEKMNDFENAIQKYQELALITKDLLYNLAYGKILLQCHHFNQAQEIFETIIQNYKQNEIAQIYKCLTLIKGQQLELALKQSEMLINTRENVIYGYILKGLILKMQKKNQEVTQISNQLILSFPDNRWNHFFQSIILMVDCNFWDAYGYIQKIKDDTYIKENLKYTEVVCLLQINKIPEAFEILKEMQNYNNYNLTLKDSFLVIKQNGMTTFGAIQYQKLFQNNPQDSEAMHFQGQCYYIELKYIKALECFNTAISINPKMAKSYYYKGQAHFKSFQFDQSLDCYLKASNLSSQFNNHYVSFHIGNLYFFQLEFEKALEAYNHAILIDCSTEMGAQRKQITSIMKAMIHWYKKENQTAIEQVDKNLQETSFMLSRIYQELNHEYQAQFHLKQFKQNNPEGTYNFQKKDYTHGQMFIKYMEKKSQQFEQLNDREYEIIKYAAWFLDQNAYDIDFGGIEWNFLRFFQQTIIVEQNKKMNEEQLKRLVKYPII